MEGYFAGIITTCCLLLLLQKGEGCNGSEFRCANNDCIYFSGRCDGRPTCSDGSDEEFCPTPPVTTPDYPPCHDDNFQCQNGRCLYRYWRCDGQNDCGDHSDEQGCDGDTNSNGLLLSTEAIIGITIALVALVLLVVGIVALLMCYHKKFTRSRTAQTHAQSVPDMLEQMSPGLLYNIPREALLREPPPMYTSQQDLSLSHVNSGFHDDENIQRPPPCYSSNPDLNVPLPTSHVMEPPPCYSSQQNFTVLETTLNANNTHSQIDVSTDSIVQGIEVIERCINERKRENEDLDKSSDDKEDLHFQGDNKKDQKSSLRKQKGFSASDSNLHISKNLVPFNGLKTDTLPANHRTGVEHESLTQSKPSSVSVVVEGSKFEAQMDNWRNQTLASQLPGRESRSCSRIPDMCISPTPVFHGHSQSVVRQHNRTSSPGSSKPQSFDIDTAANRQPHTAIETFQHQRQPSSTGRTYSTRSLDMSRGWSYAPGTTDGPSLHGGQPYPAVTQREQLRTDDTRHQLDRHASRSLPSLCSHSNGSVFLGNDNVGFEC